MKTYKDCVPCFVRQTVRMLQEQIEDENLQEKVLRNVLADLAEIDYSLTPPVIAARVHRKIIEATGVLDPWKRDRFEQNSVALRCLDNMREIVENGDDPWRSAVLLAIGGNIIDLGVYSTINEHDIEEGLTTALDQEVAQEKIEMLRNAIRDASKILYIGDNAGEIVFDRLLIEQMEDANVTFGVRGMPTLNDALMDDAEMVGMTEIVPVVSNGFDIPGTDVENSSEEFRNVWEEADLVIAKGQGNYETLSDVDKNIIFLFKAKCGVIARDAGVPLNSFVIHPSRRRG